MLLERRKRLVDLVVETVGEALVAHVGDARLGRDREAGRHPLGPEDARHLRDVGALAAEQIAHVPRALGELVDPFRRHPAGDPTGRRRGASGSPRGARASRRSRARPGAGARSSAGGVSASGRPRRRPGTRAPPGSAGTSPPRRRAHTTPPAAPENPLRCSRLAARGARGELRREAGGEQQLEAEGELVGVPGALRIGCRAARARCRAGCRRRDAARRCRTAARPRRRRERRCRAPRRRSRRRGWPATVSAAVTVSRSLRPSWSTRLSRKKGSRRPPKRLRARRTPLAIAPSGRAAGYTHAGCGRPRRSAASAARPPGPSPGRPRHPRYT